MSSQMEIARLANVSQSVVSRVLNGRAKEFGIADDTVARIRQIAEAVDYRPNHAANMLLGRKTKLIGVIIRSFEDQFLATILDELNRRALQAGYALIVVGLEQGEFNATEIRLLQSYRPEAFVVVGSVDFSRWDRAFLDAADLVIQIGAPVADPRVVTCGTDEAAAAALVVRHLLDLGHRRFGLVGDATTPSRLRAQALRAALREHGHAVPLPYAYLSEERATAAGVDGARYFLHDSDRANWPTAIMATGDLIALSFIRALGDAGVRVPDDVSVSSYNDIELAALARPSLTTIHQPVRHLAATGMEIITGARPRANVLLPPLLRVRESTAALAPGPAA